MRQMKDSGVEWIGEIPSNWTCCKQKYELQLINGRAFSDSEFEEDGKYRILRVGNLASNPVWYTSSMELSEDKYCVSGDLLYSWSMSYAPIIWTGEKVIYHYHIWKVKPSNSINKRFAYYYLDALTSALKAEIHETTMGFITMGIMNNSYMAFPELKEQQCVADYIDLKCAEIDSLSADIQKQIGTLEEYKRSVITEAVTKGLDPNVEMKASGIPWASEIPQHWDISKIKYEIIPIQRAVRDTDGVITCFRDGEVTLRQNRREEGFTISMTEHGYHGVDVGDLVIHGMDAFAGAIGCSDSRGKITPVVHVCKTTGNNRYFMYVLRSMAANDVLMTFAEGIRVRSSDFRNFNKLGKFALAVPTVSEQDQIVAYLDRICADADAVIEQKQQQLETLSDYKKSLIYEYVTGKKEVPNEYHPE